MTQHILTIHNYLQSPIEGLVNYFKEARRAAEYQKAVRQTAKQLRALSDKELNDIGITRGDIYSVARGDVSYKRHVDHNPNLKGWV